MNTTLIVPSSDRVGPSADYSTTSKLRDSLNISNKFSFRDSGLFGTKIQLEPTDKAEETPSPKVIAEEPPKMEDVKEEVPEIPAVFNEAIQMLKGISQDDGRRTKSGADQSIEATKASVESKISAYINEKCTTILSQHHGEDKSEVDKMLFASNTVLTLLLDVLQTIMASHPLQESFILVQMVHQEFINCIISSKISTLCEEQLHDLKPGDIGNLISWMNHCSERWRQTHPVLSMMTKDDVTQTNMETLLEEYLTRGVQEPVKDMLANMLEALSDEDVIENENGQLATYQPLDIAFMLEGQLSVAKDILPTKHVHHVLAAFNEQLRAMIGNIMLDIESGWKSMAVVRLCSVINDAAKLSDQCEGHNDELLVSNGSEEQVEAGNDLCREFLELSLHAAKYLCERILLDLREPQAILTKVGESIWEEEEGSTMVASTVATLIDYFEDLEEWIPHYYFAKCLKHSFDLTLQIYIDSFFSNTMAKGLKEPQSASTALHYDCSALLTFFGTTLSEYHGRAGFYSKEVIEERLQIISCLSKLLDATSQPTKLEIQIKTLLVQLGTDSGVPAVLHLAGLRKSNVDVTESSEWHVTISRVTQALKDTDISITTGHYKVPDLRNSEYIKKVKPIVNDDDSTMDATNRLVQRPGLNRNWSWRARPNNPLMSQQSRRNLQTNKSERNLIPNNRRPGLQLNKLYSARFNYRSNRNLGKQEEEESRDDDAATELKSEDNVVEDRDDETSSIDGNPHDQSVAETKSRVTFADEGQETKPRVTFADEAPKTRRRITFEDEEGEI